MASTYIQLPNSEWLDVDKIIAFSIKGNRTKFECTDQVTKFGVYSNDDEALAGYIQYKIIIFGTATTVTMQDIEDIYDTPISNPPDPTKPAMYHQIGAAVYWKWSIAESKWYPMMT
jgi:hypothetical protein